MILDQPILDDIEAHAQDSYELLLELAQAEPEVAVRYFCPDRTKDGGTYVTVRGKLHTVDPIARVMKLKNGTQIPLDVVVDLDSPLFTELY